MKFSSEFMEIVDDARGRVTRFRSRKPEKVAGGANLRRPRDNEWEAGHAKARSSRARNH